MTLLPTLLLTAAGQGVSNAPRAWSVVENEGEYTESVFEFRLLPSCQAIMSSSWRLLGRAAAWRCNNSFPPVVEEDKLFVAI